MYTGRPFEVLALAQPRGGGSGGTPEIGFVAQWPGKKVDKQQQLEGMCMELKAANSKGNSRKLFQIVKSMTRKFQPRLQGIQSGTGENLTEAAQIADRWKGYCEDLYCD